MWPAERHSMFWTSLPEVSGGEMLDTQEEQWHGVGRRTMAGVFSLDRPGIFWLLLVLLFWLWFASESLCRGSLTQRCGRGESAIRGRAVGFRVGHREGHWAGHWGRWRQQEGAWHFALAAPVRLQTTQKGSGGRHATIRRQGMKRTQLRRPAPKNIHDGGGRQKRGRGGVWEKQAKEWWMWTENCMEVWKIIITTGLIGVGARAWGERIHGGVFHGEWKRKVSTLIGWVQPEDGKKWKKPWENTCLHKHHTTNNASTKQPTWTKKKQSKKTARDENRNTMTPIQGYAGLITLVLMVQPLRELGGAKTIKNKGTIEGIGERGH